MIEEPTDKDNDPNTESIPTNTIGQFITIIGEITGKENILVEGHIEGNLIFPQFNVTVGNHGRVNANITAREIFVEGEVKGDLQASELINIKPSGKVTGNIRALQVVLNQGCQFKGAVDMTETHTHTTTESRTTKPKLTDNKRLPAGSGSAGGSSQPKSPSTSQSQPKTFPMFRRKEES